MMKRNMSFIVLVLVVLCLNTNRAIAQDRSYEGTITIVPVRLEQLGETVHIDFDILMKDVKVKSAHGVDLIPQLVSPTTTYELPRVSIKGKNEYLVHERRLAVMSAKAKKNYKAPYLIEKNQKKKSGVICYRYTLPYEPWMADAGLNVQRDECGCGESALMNVEHTFDRVTLERMLVPYVVTPHLSYVEPKVEEIKSRDIQAECFLDFEVNKVDIRPEYMSNPQELAKIRAMIDDLKSDANVNVKRLDIIGYASLKERWLQTNVYPKGVLWHCATIWLPGMISRVINTISYSVVKTGMDWWRRWIRLRWIIKKRFWISSRMFLLKKEGNEVDAASWWCALSAYVEGIISKSARSYL